MQSLKYFFPDKQKTFVMGIMQDKDYYSMINIASNYAKRFIAVDINDSRTAKSMQLAKEMKKYTSQVYECYSTKDALYKCLKVSPIEDVICVFGSLYLIGDMKKVLENRTLTSSVVEHTACI